MVEELGDSHDHTTVPGLKQWTSRVQKKDNVRIGMCREFGIGELTASISSQQVNHGYLSPFIHVDQSSTKSAVVLVKEVVPVGTDL